MTGAGHFRTPVWKGIEIIEGLRGHISGLGVPTYVVDATRGGGKIPLGPNYLVSASNDSVVLRNYEGMMIHYHPTGEPLARPCRGSRDAQGQRPASKGQAESPDPRGEPAAPAAGEGARQERQRPTQRDERPPEARQRQGRERPRQRSRALRIGIAFDLAPDRPRPRPRKAGPDDQFEEFDKPETVEAIAAVLRGRGHEVVLLGDGSDLLRRALDDPPDLVWNMAEGHGVGRSREARVPAALEMLGIPCTGSDPLTLAATLDKDVAKRLVASEGSVKVPDGRALPTWMEREGFAKAIAPLFANPADPARRGPVLLKPSFEGSSKGIRTRCLAHSVDEAWTVYREIASTYRQTVLVEEFIRGEEVTVGLVGNVDDRSVEVLGAMRVVPTRREDDFVYSLEVKRDWRNRVRYEAPAPLDPDVAHRLFAAARACYESLGCRDLARDRLSHPRRHPLLYRSQPPCPASPP